MRLFAALAANPDVMAKLRAEQQQAPPISHDSILAALYEFGLHPKQVGLVACAEALLLRCCISCARVATYAACCGIS